MRKKLLQLAIMSSIVMFVACGKPDVGSDGEEQKKELDSKQVARIEGYIAKQRTLIEEAKLLKPKAEAGDATAARRWRFITSKERDPIGEPIDDARNVLRRVKRSPVVQDKESQLDSLRKEMDQSGWRSIMPTWLSAKLGDADAQVEIHDIFTSEYLDNDERVILMKGLARKEDRSNSWWMSDPPGAVKVEELAESRRQVSYNYLVDAFWVPPAGMWDPLYVEGRYRFDGIEFGPRDWLAKAAAADSKFKAMLAAVEFVSAKDDAERTRAAKELLSLCGSRDRIEGKSIVEPCLAAIYCRGISVPVDLSKAAEIMLSSIDSALRARGVRLASEHNLPFKESGYSRYKNNGLMYAVCSKYGWDTWPRDFERAYFEYWLFTRNIGHSVGDKNFARTELVELEKQLSAEQIISLQKKCWIWFKKFNGRSPISDDWLAR
jgi:hypothetical protein